MKRTLACVEWGNYLGRGEEYVRRLAQMAERHAPASFEYEFVCVQPDVPGLTGWWNKIELFRPGRFTGRVAYVDLDTIIMGSLPELFEDKGLLHLREWGWKESAYGSGIMVWDAGEHEEAFTRFNASTTKLFRGDQDWLRYLGGWPSLPMAKHRSYRYHCKKAPPQDGVLTVSFHGQPKPHELGGWVKEAWQ